MSTPDPVWACTGVTQPHVKNRNTTIFAFPFINLYLNSMDMPRQNSDLQQLGTSPLKELQATVDQWINTIGVRYFDPLTNMAMLAEETGEVARIMARRYGEQSEKESDKTKDLGEELADVLFVVLCLANQTGTDLQAAWESRLAKKTVRDTDRHASNPKLK